LRRLRQLCPGPACVVETGTLRDDSPRAQNGDGWSTVAWGWYCAETGGRAYTVDIDARNLEVCRRVTAPYAHAIEYVAADSLQFLRQWDPRRRGEIHLLYLDSFDYFDHQREQSVAHHRAEAEAALPALAPRCLVLFDDTSLIGSAVSGEAPRFSGKGAQAIPFLLARGFQVEWAAGGQALLSRGADEYQRTQD
jgi:hypothetical protein